MISLQEFLDRLELKLQLVAEDPVVALLLCWALIILVVSAVLIAALK